MTLLIILLLISLGFACYASVKQKNSVAVAYKLKYKRWHDYSLLFGLVMLMMLYSLI